MSIQSEINRISGNIADALAAIAEKGVTVPNGSNSDALAGLIAAIQAGGIDLPDGYAMDYGTITLAESTYSLNIGLKNTYSQKNGSYGSFYIALNTESLIGQVFVPGGFNIVLPNEKSYATGTYTNTSGAVYSTTAAYVPKQWSSQFYAASSMASQLYYLAGTTYFWMVIGEVA